MALVGNFCKQLTSACSDFSHLLTQWDNPIFIDLAWLADSGDGSVHIFLPKIWTISRGAWLDHLVYAWGCVDPVPQAGKSPCSHHHIKERPGKQRCPEVSSAPTTTVADTLKAFLSLFSFHKCTWIYFFLAFSNPCVNAFVLTLLLDHNHPKQE